MVCKYVLNKCSFSTHKNITKQINKMSKKKKKKGEQNIKNPLMKYCTNQTKYRWFINKKNK